MHIRSPNGPGFKYKEKVYQKSSVFISVIMCGFQLEFPLIPFLNADKKLPCLNC